MNKNYKLGLVGLAILYCFYFFKTIESWHFIDNVDLVIHEAGHLVFYPFGRFLTIAGGSLLQLIIPALFVGYFYKSKQMFSAAFLMCWLAVNFFNVAHYAADAVQMRLELLGGDSSGHDWHNLLSMMGLLGQTSLIANIISGLGFLSLAVALYWAYLAWLQPESPTKI
jgi:hypothetical protein